MAPLPSRSIGELNTQYRAKIKGATVDKETATLATDATEKSKSSRKSLLYNKVKSRLAEVAALGRTSASDSERAWNSSASETSEKDEVPVPQNIPVQLIRMMPAATVSAATMQRAVSHATMSNLTRATASASSRIALSAQRPRSHSVEALLEEVSYKPLQPYSFPTGSIQPSQNGRHDTGDDFPVSSHTQLASASGRLDRLRLQVILTHNVICTLAADLVFCSASCAAWRVHPASNRNRQIWSSCILQLCRHRSALHIRMRTRQGCRARVTRSLRRKRKILLQHRASPALCPL
jgi:hypothetical protein